MKWSSNFLWRAYRKIVKGGAEASNTLAILTGRFPFPRDVERADSRYSESRLFRSSSRVGSVSTATSNEYVLMPNADLLNPFADYLADDAKVWTMYLDLTKSKGEELMRIWNSDLDTILIFAGLFSAILTAFLIETRKSLQPDSQVITNMLLGQVIQQLSPNPQNITSKPTQFRPSSPLVWVNGLWFVSLTFSLAGAFGTILAKGWVSQFIPASAGLPIVDACNRHRRFFGDDQRHLRAVIASLPITLHIGFYLFFGGLVILLFQDDPRIAIVVTSLIAITMLLYLGCSVRPILNPNSPFRTPISGLLPVVPLLLLPCILICDAIGYLFFTPRQRRHKARRIIHAGTYTKFDNLCLSVTGMRKLWMKNILSTATALYHLMLVSNPPSDELRTDVLVGLFSLARSYNLEDPVCALAGLPLTARLQEALYSTDPLPALTRNLAEIFSNSKKTESPEIAQAYLTVLLSLVQTTNSSLSWTASSLVPLLEPSGILSSWDLYQGDILELVICIHIHVRVRSGHLLPVDFTDRIPDVVLKCTKPLHRRLLIEACLVLSVMDKGLTLENLLKDDLIRQMLLSPTLGSTLLHMIKNPQKRVQRAVLSSISAIAVYKSGCAALIQQNILKMLLDHIPTSDSQFQADAVLIFSVFLRHDQQDNWDENEEEIYDQSMLQPWMESIFSLFLAAMLKSEQLNVQESAVAILLLFLNHEYPREQFLQLDHPSALLSMLETRESNVQIGAIQVLNILISHEDARSAINQLEFCRAIASTMQDSTPHIQRYILDFILSCLKFDDLKSTLIPELEQPLNELFKFENTMSEFTDKLFSVLHRISCDRSICNSLLTSDVIFFLLNTITNVESVTIMSINLAYHTLINILNHKHGSLNFLGEISNDAKKPLVPNHLIQSIVHLLESGNSSSQILSMELLFNCLPYFDLRQQLNSSRIIHLLGQRLDLGETPVKRASINALLRLIEYDHIRPVVIKSSIAKSLLSILWRDWTELSEPLLKLLLICLKYNPNPISLLPESASEILAELLESASSHALLAALTIISECIKTNQFKNYSTIMKFLSTQVVMKVTDIFCSTTQLAIQERAGETLHHIVNHDLLRPILVMEDFVSSLLSASMSNDLSFQYLAIDLLLNLAGQELDSPLSKAGHLKTLVKILQTSDYHVQVVILKIISHVIQTEQARDTIIMENILDKVLSLGTSPDVQVSRTVLHVIEIFFTYDDLRQEVDLTVFMQLVIYNLHQNSPQLHAAVCHTFVSLAAYSDIHDKITHPEITRPIYRSLYQSFSPMTFNYNLTSSQRHYFSRILEIMKSINSTSLQEMMQDITPTSPADPDIAFQHASLDFPDDLDSYQHEHSILDDSDSSFFHVDL